MLERYATFGPHWSDPAPGGTRVNHKVEEILGRPEEVAPLVPTRTVFHIDEVDRFATKLEGSCQGVFPSQASRAVPTGIPAKLFRVLRLDRSPQVHCVMPVIGLVFLILYLVGFRIGGAPSEVWLIFLAVCLLFGLLAGGYRWYLSRTVASAPAPPQPDAGGSLPGFIMYPDAIVHVCDGT